MICDVMKGPETGALFVDAGIETIRFLLTNGSGDERQWSISACEGISAVDLSCVGTQTPVYLTGKLQEIVRQSVARGEGFSSLAVLWSAAAELATGQSVAVIELSASGFSLVGVDNQGQLKDNLLVTNPRCGAGPGINLDRVLRKLSIERLQVDILLEGFLDNAGQDARRKIPTRADRCGVFASSATVSDKNQGIPIDFALATTLKSEVLKACKHLKTRFDKVVLTGGVFHWKFARDCAADYLTSLGIASIEHDQTGELMFLGLQRLTRGDRKWPVPSFALSQQEPAERTFPGFAELNASLSARHLFKRMTPDSRSMADVSLAGHVPVLIGIDIGSTMAKIVVCASDSTEVLYKAAYSNAGDTIETIKAVFRDLRVKAGSCLTVSAIGLTGSARYQVQQALCSVYPQLADRITVLVENYAHARGSVSLARQYLDDLAALGIENLNRDLCLLVDVGGEDTKISSIDLQGGDLYDNAMNSKCSAGTGSLMDTLVDLFSLDSIGVAISEAMAAPRATALNATCAVFLLEHARRLQAKGVPRDEILASAVWAIVENMARSLWPQINMPRHTLVLLHGQTMLSDPMPLAVADRLQAFLGGPAYCLVPEDPGHRACLGLIQTLAEIPCGTTVSLPLNIFIDQPFSRRNVQCHGVACGDGSARCHRSQLTAKDADGAPFSINLGGCSLINEHSVKTRKGRTTVRDTCRDIWRFQSERLPVSDQANRLVIPRSFAVSEWACFFASLFSPCGIPVHVDSPTEQDVLRGQAHFRVDTCAPHIGVVGQFMRLAEQPHGMILAPQIEFLPVKAGSLGRTCTINQGGFAVAQGVAKSVFPQSRFALFSVDLKISDQELLAHKLYTKLLPVYKHYAIEMPFEAFLPLVRQALDEQRQFRRQTADFAAELAREAVAEGHGIALVIGREYILNPGVYDSHVGRLLRDKGLVGIPSYILEADCDPKYAHLYWRNAHVIASMVDAATRRSLHKIIPHAGLRKIIEEIEQGEALLPIVQVSTFLCGPDSVTNPLLSEIVKNRPYLRLQTDAAIKELAHLENRMNTYVNQLTLKRKQRFITGDSDGFDVQLLDVMVNRDPLNPQEDVICVPTLADNRALLAVLRGAGFDCLENFDNEYQLHDLIEQGRRIAGDGVCAPLAAVYGDILKAISRFQKLRLIDPSYAGKKRLLIFNNKGLGPCRQGQYVEAHKLLLSQSILASQETQAKDDAELLIKFLVAHENQGFAAGFPGWVLLRGIQATVLQGVMHQLQAEGSARCASDDEYQAFQDEFKELTQRILAMIETRWVPGEKALRWCQRLRRYPGIYQLTAFFAWGLHRNPLGPLLREFRKKWCAKPLPASHIRIHIDGEAYMRTAQFEPLHQGLLELLGFGRFHLTYTPLWGFLEYKLAGMLMRAREGISESRAEINRGGTKEFVGKRKKFLRKKQQRFLAVTGLHVLLRHVLAGPLYRAAGIPLPESLPKVLEMAKKVIATRRPGGELIPYVGEAALKLDKGYDLILNVAPEGCMVSSMGEVITPAINDAVPMAKGKIQPIFSHQGDVDLDKLNQALLQALGPDKVCGRR